ncbi:ABC transporter permease [Streptomyces sp. NPDC012693]|jgi:ABC-type transport system involved in multi-copper enzyme maturation permease subunit|uniref:ABC transporter permease n=1 Tax=unclassified Streptomyces TaxID=2593676 RepID=UPI00202FFCC8|nr:ABC transporter permease [Streptomyces sp. MSC1_001]
MSTLTLKGTSWVTVRQYRRTLWLAGALVVLALAVIGGLRIWDLQYPDLRIEDRYEVVSDDNRAYGVLRFAVEQLSTGLVLLPLLVGAFVAGPLIAREYESGTYQLSLTQSVSPTAWLRAKLLVATAAALLTTLALMAVFRIGWGRTSGTWALHWAGRGPYEATGVVLVAHLLAAVAVGALLGLLIRRALVAMAATGLVMGIVLLALGAFRWSFLPVQTITGPAGPALPLSVDSLTMESGLLTATGARFDERICWEEAARTPGTDHITGLWNKVEAQCQVRHGVTAQYIDFHPQSHFWPTQLIETGIVLALAALAAFAAFRVLRARHA